MNITDRVERQLYLLSYFYSQYDRHLPIQAVIRYEDMINSGGRTLSCMVTSAAALSEHLESRNKQYDQESMDSLAQRLLESEGVYWKFYSREDVESLWRSTYAASPLSP
jgi:hypothetical protein